MLKNNIPKLKLWQSSNEGSKFFISFSRKRGTFYKYEISLRNMKYHNSPVVSQSSSSNAGSIFGDKNKMNKFKMYIAKAYDMMYHPYNDTCMVVVMINHAVPADSKL